MIVPVRNGARTLPALLEGLRRQTLPRDRFEVVVVDNASTDGTASTAAAYDAVVVDEPIANRARARNRGVTAARAALYAFTDADCVPEPGWLEALHDCAPKAPLVAGDVRVGLSADPGAIERFEALWRFGQSAWVQQGWAATANLLVARGAFDAVGGFDPAWRHIAEDADFCLRARDAGYRLEYCPDAVVEHAAERAMMPFLRRSFLHGYSSNQAHYRLGLGERAWRKPLPAIHGDRALRAIGHTPEGFEAREWRRMARLAQLGYAARVVGSAWAEVRRAR